VKNNLFKRLAELKFRAYREQQIIEKTVANPSELESHPSVAPPQSSPQPLTETPEDSEAMDEDDAKDMPVQSQVEILGRLDPQTASDIAAFMAAPDRDDDEPQPSQKESEASAFVKADLLTRVLRDVEHRKTRTQNIWLVLLDSSVGAAHREETHRTFFSPLYVSLQDIYESISTKEKTFRVSQCSDFLNFSPLRCTTRTYRYIGNR
jgi:hypothetical protein